MVSAFRKIASGHDAFFEAAAGRKQASFLFAPIVKAPLRLSRETASALGLWAVAAAVGGGVSFELVKSASISVHVIDLHIELKTN